MGDKLPSVNSRKADAVEYSSADILAALNAVYAKPNGDDVTFLRAAARALVRADGTEVWSCEERPYPGRASANEGIEASEMNSPAKTEE